MLKALETKTLPVAEFVDAGLIIHLKINHLHDDNLVDCENINCDYYVYQVGLSSFGR